MRLLRITPLIFLVSLLPYLSNAGTVELISVENLVEVSTDSGSSWNKAASGKLLDYGDRVRTGEYSRASLRYPSGNIIRLSEFSQITLAESRDTEKTGAKKLSIQLKEGALYFFSRKKESESNVKTPTVNAAIRGTEFELRVLPDQSTELSLFEGEVELENPAGTLLMQSGSRARAGLNQAPKLLPAIEARSYMQWYLFYPGALDTKEIQLSNAHKASLAAYESGDLLAALEQLPQSRQNNPSTGQALFEAAVILAAGQVEAARTRLDRINTTDARALKELIQAVSGKPEASLAVPESATAWIARSYTLQALGDLHGARSAAQHAVELSPEFGYGWARLARMQFSFGNFNEMERALKKALEYNIRNPEVYVLRGFERSASGKMDSAGDAFESALELAPNYPEAWLGQALVKFNQGEKEAALQDMLAAAALQPNNSMLRSYLAKAFAENHEAPIPLLRDTPNGYLAKALHELELGKQLDPADPTPWLYSALIKRDSLRYNEALADLQQSIELNDNRSLFRSKSLLDEDIAVRRSNLAEIYQEAGLPTQALAEAGKAVQSDYTNFAAHDFLARVYRERFDTTNINQRNDNALANEFFLRNILAPVGAGIASQKISNQEYSSLFNEQGLSGTIEASYDSRERYSTSGIFTYQGSNYEIAVELEHEDWDSSTINDDFESTTGQLHLKYQPTAQDRFYSLIVWSDTEQGDLRALPDHEAVNRAVRSYEIADGSAPLIPAGSTVFSPVALGDYEVNAAYGRDPEFEAEEEQKPLFFQTYAREWNENHTSLFLYGWADTERSLKDPLAVASSYNNSTDPATARSYESSYEIEQEFTLHTFELQHIWQQDSSQLIAGARVQTGDIEDDITMRAAVSNTIPDFLLPFIVPFAINSDGTDAIEDDFERVTVYGQFSQAITSTFTLVAGLKYDYMEYTDGISSTPIATDGTDEGQISPQAGFIWQMTPEWLLRGAYARSMSGYQIEDRLRLEPTNIGGLTTNYASIAPTQLIANMPGGTIETVEFALTGKVFEHTYFSANAAYGSFDGDRTLGQFNESIPLGTFPNDPGELDIAKIEQSIDYEEFRISTRLDHLLNNRASIGVSIDWQYAEIDENLDSGVTVAPTSPYLDDTNAHLYIGSIYGRYQDPNGWFAQTDLQYWYQENNSIAPDIDNESAPNLNLSFGYSLQKQKGEVRISILNLTDEDYELNPLNDYSLPPQERTFVIETRFSF